MQKVSKQSLAMLALSILLAISIALTFTFAAVDDKSESATGTITFNGNIAIDMNGFADANSDGTYEFAVTADSAAGATIADSYKIGLADSSINAYIKITIGSKTGTNASAVTITSLVDDSVTTYTEKDGTTIVSTDKIVKGSTGLVQLNKLISVSVDWSAISSADAVTFTIDVDASAVTDYDA